MDYNSTNQKLDSLINKLENIDIVVTSDELKDQKKINNLNYLLNKLKFLEQTTFAKKNIIETLLCENNTSETSINNEKNEENEKK